ncbi:MAG: ATP-grasp domain-containing protein [Candidatus Limivivens sp.]|nr:ATP-grasp domain-containing protein [Candidatus Limivivens sp.]
MKKLMIMGAGASQVPLIQAAKRLGYHTIVTSIPGNYPGFSIADTCCYADISKPEEVLEAAVKYGISGITTCGMDTGIRAIGRVCDELGLTGISYEAACTFTDKYLSKKSFQTSRTPCAEAFRIEKRTDLEEALQKLRLPVVLKAVDLMGSRGIYRCDTKEEAFANCEKVMEHTSRDYCLAEEFLEGLLFGAEGMMTDGKLDYLLPYGTDIYHESTIATSIGHFVPFPDAAQYQEQMEETLLGALRGAGARSTPFNCDLMLKDGKVYLIEINGRAGASCLSETVGIYFGIDYYETICRQAMGEPVRDCFRLKNGRGRASISRMLTADRDGILEEIRLPREEKTENYELILNVREGDPVRFYQYGRDRLGQVIVQGDSLMECREAMENVLADIHFGIRDRN